MSLSKEECEEIREEYTTTDKSYADIADQYGVKSSTLSYHINDNCSHSREGPHSIQPEDCARLRRLKRSGMELSEVADRDDVPWSDSSVSHHQGGGCGHEFPEGEEPIPGRVNAIGSDKCIELRKRYKNEDVSCKDLGQASGWTRSGVAKHVFGDCTCNVDESPAERPYAPPSDPLTPEECATVRERYANGEDTDEIAATFSHHEGALSRHIFGQCSHSETEVGVPPCESHHFVNPNLCETLRQEYKNGISTIDLSKKYDSNTSTVTMHVFGRCEHDVDESPSESPHRHGEGRITVERCEELRRTMREDSLSTTEMAERADRSHNRTMIHAYGHCRHNDRVNVDPIEMDPIDLHPLSKVNADLCAILRWKYKMGSPNREMANNHSCSLSTIQKHVFGNCCHEDVVESPAEPGACGDSYGRRANPRTYSEDSSIAPDSTSSES